MKAAIFSNDKLSIDVLNRALLESDFSRVDSFDPKDEDARRAAEDIGVNLVILDFDIPLASGLVLHIPPEAPVLAIGDFKSKQKAPASVAERFLLKPFSKDQILRAIRETLLGEINLLSDAAPSQPSNAVIADLKEQWGALTEQITLKRSSVKKLMTTPPSDLRTILMGKIDPATGMIPKDEFPFQTALVIESDKVAAKSFMKLLVDRCVMHVDIAPNGKDAWNYLQQKNYDLVILQWAIQELSGLALYNRLRSQQTTRHTPIIAISGNIKSDDFRLLDEDPAITLISAPVQEKALHAALTSVVTESTVGIKYLKPTTELVEDSLATDLFFHEKSMFTKGKAIDDLALSALKITGDRLLTEERFDEAEKAYAAAWDLGDRRLGLLTGYGKACFLNGKPDLARKIIISADALAPQNVERLCLIGEMDLSTRDVDQARETFSKVLSIDPENSKAKAGLEIADVMEKNGSSDLASPVQHFASYLNMLGINLSKSGKLTDALRYYRSAMSFVHGKDAQAKLWFNVGIVYLRGKNEADATKAFKKAYDMSDGKLAKAEKYIKSNTQKPAPELLDDEGLFERF